MDSVDPRSARRARRAELLAVAFATLAFATSAPLARLASDLPPVALAAGRTALASVLLALTQPRAVAAAYRRGSRRGALGLLGAGALLAAHFALFLGGLTCTSFAAAVGLLSLEPLAVVLVAWGAFGLAPRPGEWGGLFLATAGAFVVSRGAGVGEHRLVGDAMIVGAVILYGLYVAAARGLREAMPAIPYAAAVYAFAAVVLSPFALVTVRGIAAPSATTWIALGLLALIPTTVGHTLVQVAARTAPPTIVALTSPGETVGSLAIGALLLGRWPTPVEAAGTVLILAGAVVAIRGAARGFSDAGAEVRSVE
jgi:drug/metabolite transporter (DMT)-like permease